MRLVETKLFPIFEQLQLEEALLRTTDQNWCLINEGSPPAIVMGISQNPALVINQEAHQKLPIPIIRRYSGGGTVVVEPTTVFVTLILNHDRLPVSPFPKEVLNWTDSLYKNLPFSLKENDYVIGHKKCGGNAQYFAKKRIVHHTSFVFDYSHDHMNLLHMPPKMPAYREARSHTEFIECLKHHFESPQAFSKAILNAISQNFILDPCPLDQAQVHLLQSHRKSTCLES